MDEINLHFHINTNTQEIVGLLRAIETTLKHQGHQMSALTDALTALQSTASQIETAEQSVAAFVAGLPAIIQAAVDQAVAAGADPATLQGFADLNTRLQSDAAKIASDLVTPTPPPPPAA